MCVSVGVCVSWRYLLLKIMGCMFYHIYIHTHTHSLSLGSFFISIPSLGSYTFFTFATENPVMFHFLTDALCSEDLHLRYSCRMHHSQRQGLKVCVWEREIPFISLPDLMQEMNPSRILKSINLARLLSPPSWQQALNHINVFFCQLKKKTSSFQVVTDHLLHPQQCA